MHALDLYAGPAALRHLQAHGLAPEHIRMIPGAAGGPKGLVLNPLDQFVFGQWLAESRHTVHLLGASIGAWRMATATLRDTQAAFARLARDYIAQDYDVEPGRKS
ncbi:MAG: phospholipase, partial [Betaproteobacteria bacterium]|nr:phospholipase [Betaproteobacteria bacterium]